jgi:hypothetical protein
VDLNFPLQQSKLTTLQKKYFGDLLIKRHTRAWHLAQGSVPERFNIGMNVALGRPPRTAKRHQSNDTVHVVRTGAGGSIAALKNNSLLPEVDATAASFRDGQMRSVFCTAASTG